MSVIVHFDKDEATRAAAGTLTVIEREIKPQPPTIYTDPLTITGDWWAWSKPNQGYEPFTIRCPYPEGTELICKETCWIQGVFIEKGCHGNYVFCDGTDEWYQMALKYNYKPIDLVKVNYLRQPNDGWYIAWEYRTPATMPRWAVRPENIRISKRCIPVLREGVWFWAITV